MKIAPRLVTFMFVLFVLFLFLFLANRYPSEHYTGQNVIIAEHEAIKHVRNNIAPSVFGLQVSLSFAPVNKKNPLASHYPKNCKAHAIGTAFVVSKNGYFATNAHTLEADRLTQACLAEIQKNPLPPNISAFDLVFTPRYILTDSSGKKYDAIPVKKWPYQEKDIGVLKTIYSGHIFQPLTFSNQTNLSDEPIAVIGSPLNAEGLLATGKIGRNKLFEFEGQQFMLIFGPFYQGNSGGPVVSLTDMKVVGMVTINLTPGTSRDAVSQISGMIPASVVQDALNEVAMH